MNQTRERIERTDARIPNEAWGDPNVLDARLLEIGLLRSDAGALPGAHINVAPANGTGKTALSRIAAILALQRAALTIASCEDRNPTKEEVNAALMPAPELGKLYSTLLDADIQDAITEGLNAVPPGDVFNYEEGIVAAGLARAITAIGRPSYEQLGVASDLAGDQDILSLLPINTVYETSAGRGARLIDVGADQNDRNAVAWLKRNPNAGDDRFARYLKAYGSTPEELFARL